MTGKPEMSRRQVAERVRKTHVLTYAHGLSGRQISEELGVDYRTVLRYRAKARELYGTPRSFIGRWDVSESKRRAA